MGHLGPSGRSKEGIIIRESWALVRAEKLHIGAEKLRIGAEKLHIEAGKLRIGADKLRIGTVCRAAQVSKTICKQVRSHSAPIRNFSSSDS